MAGRDGDVAEATTCIVLQGAGRHTEGASSKQAQQIEATRMPAPLVNQKKHKKHETSTGSAINMYDIVSSLFVEKIQYLALTTLFITPFTFCLLQDKIGCILAVADGMNMQTRE